MRAIQDVTGHANLSTTQRYMHLSPAAKEAAIRLLDSADGGEIGETKLLTVASSVDPLMRARIIAALDT